jgi:glycosyltransferase involved in cell wall biosynthesis
MKLLRLSPRVTSTSASYYQFSLGFKEQIDQTLCSLLEHDVLIDKNIKVFHGDGSILKMLKLIKGLVEKNKYDVVHIHNGLTGIIFIFAIFPFKLGLLKKTVFTLHNSWNVIKTRNQFLNFIVMLLSSKICTCGQSSQESLPKIIKYLLGKKTKAVVNGFDHQRIDNVENQKSNQTHFDESSKIKIVYVGGLTNTKNQIALLEALKESNIETEIIFLGDGVNKKSLIDYSKQLSDSIKISFKGLVSRDLAIEHMLEADVYVSLSKGEGLPIAALEAMYSGCFMILSTIPPHNEVSPPPERCFFVDISNKAEIIKSLNYVKDNIQHIKIGREESKEHSIRNFSVNNMLGGYQKIYDSIYAENNSS